MMNRSVVFLFISLNFIICYGNTNKFVYEDLKHTLESLQRKPDSQLKFIRLIIENAKKEKKLIQIHQAYSLASTFTRGEIQIKYGDSLLYTAQKINDTDIIGDCYLAKGMIFINNEKYPNALDSFLKGYGYIKLKNDPYLLHNTEWMY